MKVAINWPASSFTGWGVYGLNLALEIGAIELRSTFTARSDQIVVDPLRLRLLAPFIRRSNEQRPLDDSEMLIHALGNEFLPECNACIGVVFFEQPLSREAIERAKRYDVVVAGSHWNNDMLRAAGINSVLVWQGVDPSIFHPAPKHGVFANRGKFAIFSGGKAERRKGQDLVVKAFRIFARKHDDVVLVKAWASPWSELARGMDLDLSEFGDRVIDVGAVPNERMAAIYRECDVGLFPNRAEGGTNLVAMECMACGVPVILSDNTGHRDLLKFRRTMPIESHPSPLCSEWGESTVEEIVACLEAAYGCSPSICNPIEQLTWARTAHGLRRILFELTSAAAA